LASRFRLLWGHGFVMQLSEQAGVATLSVPMAGVLPVNARFAGELAVAVTVRLIRSFVPGATVAPRSIALTGEETPARSRHRTFFGCAVEFRQSRYAVTMPISVLDHPHIHADGATREALTRFADHLLRRVSNQDEDLVPRVRRLLADHSSLLQLDAGELASAMNVRERSLHKALSRAGYRLSGLVAEEMRQRAELDLRLGLTGPEISDRLGYADSSGFNRAFKRLTGLTPSQYVRRTSAVLADGAATRAP
jgi:AraC-like DNA-binding protein